MIAVDTNILVYAHHRKFQWSAMASARLRELAETGRPWAIPWPCIHEFLAIVTNPRFYTPPTPPAAALRQVEYWMDSPGLSLIGETENHSSKWFWVGRSQAARYTMPGRGDLHRARD